jgi:hypothetical protein
MLTLALTDRADFGPFVDDSHRNGCAANRGRLTF